MFFSRILLPQPDSTITFSEIMFFAPSGNNEFIELFNLSYTTPVNLSGYAIKYYTSNPDTIVNAGFGTVLMPRSYAVIFEGDYNIDTGAYAGRIPPEALKLKIKDNAFGSTGMSNTTDRTLILFTPSGATDTYTYTVAGNSHGISDEKINLFFDPNPLNWGNSRFYLGTPGYTNSVAPLARDGAITDFTIFPNPASLLDDPVIKTTVKNLGIVDIDEAFLYIYFDSNRDSAVSPDELIIDLPVQNLASGDSVEFYRYLGVYDPGDHRFFGVLSLEDDDNTDNNVAVTELYILPPPLIYNDIIINEVMYAPSGGAPEWIEIYNRTDSTINLRRWKINDRVQSSSLPDKDILILPGGYAVIADDSTIYNYFPGVKNVTIINLPSLNNDTDAITLKDSYGYRIDSLFYRSSWGGASGKSLERIYPDSSTQDSTNWKTSLIFATPGSPNSVSPKQRDVIVSAVRSIPHQPLRGDNVSLYVYAKNIGTVNALVDIYVYHDINRDSVPDVLLSQSSMIALAPGDSIVEFYPDIIPAITTDHVLIIKAVVPFDEDTTNNRISTIVRVNESHKTIMVNEVMYAPTSGAPEWIEVFNRSGTLINLRKWKISDGSQSVSLPDKDIFLPLLNLLVIADDSSFFEYYPGTPNVIITSLPSLNNSGDAVVVMDSLGRVSDSLYYYPRWGGSDGRSLERIDAELPTLDSANWRSSRIDATPGFINTASAKVFDISVEGVLIAPLYPSPGDSVSASVFCRNYGSASASFEIVVYADTNKDSVPDQFLARSPLLFLPSRDSVSYLFNNIIGNLSSELNFWVSAVFAPDQDTSNNIMIIPLKMFAPAASIVINEIMYSPVNGMPEWIELYNNSSLPADLSGWKIRDAFTTPASVTLPNGTQIQPGGYLVIAEDSLITTYFRENNYPLAVINLPPLNNDREGLVLIDKSGRVIDTVYYTSSFGGSGGYSLERITPGAAVTGINWRECGYREKGTPGRINSVTPKAIDPEVKSLTISPQYPDLNDTVSAVITVRNNGVYPSAAGLLNVYIDSVSPSKLHDLIIINPVAPADSVIIAVRPYVFNSGFRFIASLTSTGDADTYNNVLHELVIPGAEKKRVIISEVMPNPATGEKEWIELYNNSDKPFTLSGWSLGNISITNPAAVIPAYSYLVVSSDTSLSAKYGSEFQTIYGNVSGLAAGDIIVLRDHRSAPIDSFVIGSFPSLYSRHSIEKISGGNSSDFYHPSIDTLLATPGKVNSLAEVDTNKTGAVVNEIMFEVDGGLSEYIEIYNQGRDTLNTALMKISISNSAPIPLSPVTRPLLPGGYVVIANDSSFYNMFSDLAGNKNAVISKNGFTLSNDGGTVRLTNIFGGVYDSAAYNPNWYGKLYGITRNRSLEKINPALPGITQGNWAGTADPSGGTPARINSVFTGLLPSSSAISVNPNPFSPDYDGYEDQAIISYNLVNSSNLVTIKIFDGSGREVRTLHENLPSGASGSTAFDGLDASGKPLPIGIYIIYLEARGTSGSFSQKLKTVVVSARKL